MFYFFDIKNKNSLLFYAFIISISIVIIRYVGAVNPDIEWLILCAKRLFSGGKFYDDFYEINTPSSIILYFIPVIVGDFLSIPAFLLTYIMVIIAILGVIILCNLIIGRQYEIINNNYLKFFILAFLLSYMVIPYLGVAQKDHFIAVFIFPYALIIFSPKIFESNRELKLTHFLASVLFGFAILLKPYYVLTLLGLHGVAYLNFRTFRFYFFNLAIIFITCIIFILFYLDYYISWYPIAQEGVRLYEGYNVGSSNVLMNLLWNLMPLYFLSIIIYKNNNYKSYRLNKDLCYTLCGLAICCVPAYFIQKKGWYYQLLPVVLPLWVIIFFPFLSMFYEKNNKYGLLKFIVFVLFGLYIFQSWFCKSFYSPGEISTSRKWAEKVVLMLKPNDAFVCISHSMECPFALQHLGDYRYVSRQAIILSSVGALNLWRKGKVKKEFFVHYFKRDLNNLSQDILKGNAKLLIVEWEYSKDENIDTYGDSKEFKKLLSLFQFKLVNYIKDYPEPSKATWIFLRE